MPHNLVPVRAIAAVPADDWRRSCVSIPDSIRRCLRSRASRRVPRRDYRANASAVMAFTGSPTTMSRDGWKQIVPEIADARVIVAHLGAGASLCAIKAAPASRRHGIQHARRADDGDALRQSRSRRDPASDARRGAAWGRSRTFSIAGRGCSACRGSAATCRSCSRSDTERRAAAIDLFTYRIAAEIGALGSALGGIDASGLHRRHRGAFPRDPRHGRRSVSPGSA